MQFGRNSIEHGRMSAVNAVRVAPANEPGFATRAAKQSFMGRNRREGGYSKAVTRCDKSMSGLSKTQHLGIGNHPVAFIQSVGFPRNSFVI
jgi:hypothetical protein